MIHTPVYSLIEQSIAIRYLDKNRTQLIGAWTIEAPLYALSIHFILKVLTKANDPYTVYIVTVTGVIYHWN